MQRRAGERVSTDMKLVASVMLLALAATSAVAQPGAGAGTDLKAQDCARARKAGKACVLTFDQGDTIEGGVDKGDGEDYAARDLVTFSSLIRIRADFIAEIIRAAEDL